MKSDQVKKFLLLVLLVVALYIWWGNLKLFYAVPETEYSQPPVESGTQEFVSSSALAYVPPKVNPFYRSTPAISPTGVGKPPPPPPPEKLSRTFRLVGTVGRGKNSQVVIADPSGRQTILTVGDTLLAWRLIEIRDDFATFKQAKWHDTLRLGTAKL